MSSASRTLASVARMRILALPLTRPSAPQLTYFYAQILTTPDVAPTRVTKVINWAGRQWAGLGKAKSDTWKYKAYVSSRPLCPDSSERW